MDFELALTVILIAIVALLVAAQFLRIPYPIMLVIGGLALGLIPPLPDVELEPDVVLVVLLPPLLYAAAFFTPLRELRRNVGSISLLAIGLVLATMVGVAVVAHEVLEFGWAEAFVLGTIVSPTDPVAATAIARRLNVPGRIVTVVEGESLINDGTALVAYKFAVAAVLTGSFSLLEASWRVRGQRPRRDRRRDRDRRRHRLRPPPHPRTTRRDHDRPVQRLLRLPAGGGDRRLRDPGRGHGRDLHGTPDLAAHLADDPDPGSRRLRDRPVPAQLRALRADRTAAARDPRRHRGGRRAAI